MSGGPKGGKGEQVPHTSCGRHGLRDRLSERVVGRAQVWLSLQLAEQRARKPLQQCDQARAVRLLAEPARRRLLEVMRLVDVQVVVLRQKTATQLGAGDEHGVV